MKNISDKAIEKEWSESDMIELILSKLKITEAQHGVAHWCWEDKLYGNYILKFNGTTIYSNCFEKRRKCMRK